VTVTELLVQRGRAPQSASKTVTAYRFEVPPGTPALTLTFDYGPRESRDLATNLPQVEQAFAKHIARRRDLLGPDGVARHRKALAVDERAKVLANLMNVVIVDPRGRWRGRWDRLPAAASGQLLLSRDAASRGFVPGDIEPGSWTAAVECHGVFGETVDYELRVIARPAPDDHERAALVETGYSEPPRAPGGPGWLFGELHSHSSHSDGKHELGDIADRAARAGLDFLAMTDHNAMSAHPVAAGAPVVIVPGFELTTFHGHHPIYGLDHVVPWHVDGRVLPLAELAPRIRAAGGLIGVAHPFVPGDPLCTGCRMIDALPPAAFDMMEVWYRRWTSPGSDNQAGYEMWDRLWREGNGRTGVAARDWHGPEQEAPFPGEFPLTGVYAESATPEAILAGLRAGRAIMSRGPIVDVSTSGGLTIRVERMFGPAELRVLRTGEVIDRRPLRSDGVVELDLPGPGHYRAELWDGDDPVTLTNHVTVTA
jgi:hypothetical protein